MEPEYYILIGEEAIQSTFMEWAIFFADRNKCMVELTAVGDVMVSTVFLGMNHAWHHTAAPLIFETMVFGGDYDQEQQRYSTMAEARAGHHAMCAKVFGE